MKTRSVIEELINESEKRGELANKFKAFIEKYESVEGVFDMNGKEVEKGYFDELVECKDINEACDKWKYGELLHIREDGKLFLGVKKLLSKEFEGQVFCIDNLSYL